MAICALALEVGLARRGFEATAVDTEERWVQERVRATRLGPSGIVLVGSSRIQLGLDVPLLARITRRPVVQLAVDGSSFGPVLRGLATDDRFSGTVWVDYLDDFVVELERRDTAAAYQLAFETRERTDEGMAERAESWLSRQLHLKFRAYADGATPWRSIVTRLLVEQATPQYLVTYPDRSRAADFTRVQMPDFYWQRVLRNLDSTGAHPSRPANGRYFEEELAGAVAATPAVSSEKVRENVEMVRGWVRRIRNRGGRVVFVVMPTSGLVRTLERRRYPRADFWDRFAASVEAEAVHFEDHDTLKAFQCPDGSHLDRRDKAAFTAALADVVSSG